MLFYLLLIASSSLFATMANLEKHKRKYTMIVFYLISALILLIPLAMRDCGVDYDEYYRTYLSSERIKWNDYWKTYLGRPEPLYVVLNYAAVRIFGTYQGVNILCAVLSIGFSFAGFYRFRDEINLGMAVWSLGFSYYIMMFGLNRMMIAVSIVTWAYYYLVKKRTIRCIIWFLVAGLFHYSAFLMIPFYFLLLWIDRKKHLLRTMNVWRVALVILSLFVVIYQVVPKIFGNYPWFVRYEQYFMLSFTFEALNNNIHTYPTVLFAVLYRKRISSYLNNETLLRMLYIYMALCVTSIIMPVHRLCYFFYPCIVLLNGIIPNSNDLAFVEKRNAVQNNAVFTIIMFAVGVFEIWLLTCYAIHWSPFINPYKMGNL